VAARRAGQRSCDRRFAGEPAAARHHTGVDHRRPDGYRIGHALSQSGGYALEAQAGEAAIRRVVSDAGFTRFRRVAKTPVNLVYEARP
jgi:hypothetical protein